VAISFSLHQQSDFMNKEGVGGFSEPHRKVAAGSAGQWSHFV
jgi:hypothetical protein